MNKKQLFPHPIKTIFKLRGLAKKKESVRSKLVVTAEKLAATAREKESIRNKLAVTAKQLAATAKEKEIIRGNLATTAKEKESVRRKLAVTAEELRLKAKELKQKTRELSTLIENLPVGVYLAKAPNGEPLMVNKIGIELLGKGVDPKASKKNTYTEVYKIVKENGLPYPVKELPLTMTLSTGKTVRKTDIYIGKGSVKTPIHVTSAPIKDSQGKLISAVAVYEDVTQERALERSRDEFFSIASHELKTPLTAIRGNTSLIQEHYAEALKDPQLKEMISDIKESSVRLIEIVNDFLNVSRLEQGRMVFNNAPLDLAKTAQEVLREYQAASSRKKLGMEVTEPKEQLPIVLADKDKVKQVLINLVGNSLKFTKEGRITIEIIQEGNYIKVFVTDTGIGISPQNQKLLFKKFQQAESNIYTRDAAQGTGLGLYISKLIVEAMGGVIKLEKSEEGKGATFSFALPVVSGKGVKSKEAAATPTNG